MGAEVKIYMKKVPIGNKFKCRLLAATRRCDVEFPRKVTAIECNVEIRGKLTAIGDRVEFNKLCVCGEECSRGGNIV